MSCSFDLLSKQQITIQNNLIVTWPSKNRKFTDGYHSVNIKKQQI